MTIIRSTIDNTSSFGIGFIIGTLLDVVAAVFYVKKHSKIVLTMFIFVHLFTIFFLIEFFKLDTYGKIGLFSSQIILFEFAFKQLYNPLKSIGQDCCP